MIEKKAIKMIAIDIDVTLLNSENEISDYTAQVINQAIEQGVIVTLSTGRVADRKSVV